MMVAKMWQSQLIVIRLTGGRRFIRAEGWVRSDKPSLAVLRDGRTGKYLIHHVPSSMRLTPAQYDDAGDARAVAAQLLALPLDWGGVNSKWRLLKVLHERRLRDVVEMLVEPIHEVSVQ